MTFAARLIVKDKPRQAAIGPRPVANAETASVIMRIFKRLDPSLHQSITFNNGSEFAQHGWLYEAIDITTCFGNAYASW